MDLYEHPLDMQNYSGMKCVESGYVAMPLGAIRILRYLNSEGYEEIGYTIEGDSMLPRVLGMIEWAKWDLARGAFDPRDPDPEKDDD